MTVKKVVKRVVRKVRSKVIRRYFKPKSGYAPNVANIVKDVNFLKSIINAEKKQFVVTQSSAQTLGQVSANVSGHYIADITPQIAQGTGEGERIGNSLKLHSAYLKYQFYTQGSQVSSQNIYIEVYQTVGQIYSSMSTALTDIYVPSKLFTASDSISVYDKNALRQQDTFQNFRLIARKTIFIKGDSVSNQNQFKDVGIPLKFTKHSHIKYEDSSAVPTNGQFIIVMRMDNGNSSGSTNSTLNGVPSAYRPMNTGIQFTYTNSFWFYDN